jgi:hypothetical protein
MLRIRDFVAALKKQNRAQPVCFCSDPKGLQFYRWKIRGPQLLQIELNESVYRDASGRLVVESLSLPDFDPREYAKTVGDMLDYLNDPTILHYELIFGGDHEALKFVALRDIGEWVSIEFEAQVKRTPSGFVVGEIRDEKHIRDEFPYSKEIAPSEAGGAFAAIRRHLAKGIEGE